SHCDSQSRPIAGHCRLRHSVTVYTLKRAAIVGKAREAPRHGRQKTHIHGRVISERHRMEQAPVTYARGNVTQRLVIQGVADINPISVGSHRGRCLRRRKASFFLRRDSAARMATFSLRWHKSVVTRKKDSCRQSCATLSSQLVPAEPSPA